MPRTKPHSQGSGIIRVLIVDDDQSVREGIKAVIGHEPDIQVVGEAVNGSEAIEAARAMMPDVILMDIVMPGMDGIEATARIREKTPSARVLMLSQYRNEQYVRRAKELGVAGFVNKNLSLRDLLAAIRAAARG